jgi:hypothetical protein
MALGSRESMRELVMEDLIKPSAAKGGDNHVSLFHY